MIELNDVGRTFGGVEALAGVSLRIEQGARVAVTGPSGSGKTTLLRLIAGLEVPDSGEIRIGGRIVSRAGWIHPPHLRGIGYVFQKPCLWPHMTVAQNVSFALGARARGERQRRLEDVLALTGLTELAGRRPGELSGGQERRAALARAIAPKPEILLMDEPLTNLDGAATNAMLDLILRTVNESACTLVYVTHDMAEASALAARTILIESGRVK